MNIIFLDIDGVLNSKAYFESIKESEILATEKIHNEISEYHVKLLSVLCHACDAKVDAPAGGVFFLGGKKYVRKQRFLPDTG